MDDDPGQFALAFLTLGALLVASAFFSAAETAYVSLSSAKVRALADERRGSRAVRVLTRLHAHPQRLLAAILIASNVLNTFSAGLATVVAMRLFGDAGLGIATGVMSFLILTFTDIVPKTFAQRHAVPLALACAYPLVVVDLILFPLSWIFEKSLAALGLRRAAKTMTEDELLALVEIGHEEGEIKAHERELIENVLEFTDTHVGEVMTPRVKIDALERRTSIADAITYFLAHSHSRLPVYDTSLDTVVGVVTLRDVLEYRAVPTRAVGELPLIRPVVTPITRPIRALFQELTSRRIHLAIVVDEHGGTAGLVTLEDILEEIVGEIEDEEDVPADAIRALNAHTLLVPGATPLTEIDDRLGTMLATDKCADRNIAFLILEKLGRFPKRDERLRVDDVDLTVEEVAKHRIVSVKIDATGVSKK